MTAIRILSVLYGISGSFYLIGIWISISEVNEIRLIHGVRLMYSLVYGYFPALIYWREANGERNLAYFDYSVNGIWNLYFFYLLSLFAYGILLLFYYGILSRKSEGVKYQSQDKERSERQVLIVGSITLVVGLLSLILWTRAYGSIENFIRYANRIRSGNGQITNRFAFMKYGASVIRIALFGILTACLSKRPRGLSRILYLLLLSAAFYGTYLYLMASDGRTVIALTGIAVILLFLRYRRKEDIRPYLIRTGVLLILVLWMTMNADTFTTFIRQGEWKSSRLSFLDHLILEFRFIYSAQSYVINHTLEGTMKLKVLDDLLVAVTRWIPNRFLPFSLPDTVWLYNTENIYGASASGTSPTDLLSTGIYYFGIGGAVIWPSIVGAAVGIMDAWICNTKDRIMAEPYYGLLIGICLHSVSHNQLSAFVLALFPAFVWWIIHKFCSMFRGRDHA